VRSSFAIFAVGTWACTTVPENPPSQTPRTITLFHYADVHSHVFPRKLAVGVRDAELGLGVEGRTATVGGAARLAALLDRERARSEVSFVLDSGDALEGSAIFAAFHGVPETLSQEVLGLDAQAVGNHDLTHGAAALSDLRAGRATFPLLAANLDDLVAAGVALPSLVLERQGVRVGVVGLGRSPDGAVDLDRCAAAVEQAIAGFDAPVDAVVVLSHLGRDADLSLVPKTAGADVVLGGHTHDVLEPPKAAPDCGEAVRSRLRCVPRPVTIVHSGAYGRYLGRLDLTLSRDAVDLYAETPLKRSAVVESRYTLLPINDSLPERADLVDLLGPYRDALVRAGLEQPIAFAPAPVSRSKPARGDSALGNFVTRALRAAARADLAVINATGVRADLPEGELAADDFFEVLPLEHSWTLHKARVGGGDRAKRRSTAERSCLAATRRRAPKSGSRASRSTLAEFTESRWRLSLRKRANGSMGLERLSSVAARFGTSSSLQPGAGERARCHGPRHRLAAWTRPREPSSTGAFRGAEGLSAGRPARIG
jgi:5'-nucleotidase/UDP-sugar diphosphatase